MFAHILCASSVNRVYLHTAFGWKTLALNLHQIFIRCVCFYLTINKEKDILRCFRILLNLQLICIQISAFNHMKLAISTNRKNPLNVVYQSSVARCYTNYVNGLHILFTVFNLWLNKKEDLFNACYTQCFMKLVACYERIVLVSTQRE